MLRIASAVKYNRVSLGFCRNPITTKAHDFLWAFRFGLVASVRIELTIIRMRTGGPKPLDGDAKLTIRRESSQGSNSAPA